jgi:predicted DNA-binding WGR domain protein
MGRLPVSSASTSPQAQADNPASAASATPGSFESAARFVSVDPAKRRARFYELRLLPTLWGGVALVRAWGRLGTPGRWRAREYPDRAAAQPDVARAVRRRLGRGYRLVAVR